MNNIRLQITDSNSWHLVKFHSNAGKIVKNRSGKNKNTWNIEDQQGLIAVINFEEEIDKWYQLRTTVKSRSLD